jgi:hypothetical protein
MTPGLPFCLHTWQCCPTTLHGQYRCGAATECGGCVLLRRGVGLCVTSTAPSPVIPPAHACLLLVV